MVCNLYTVSNGEVLVVCKLYTVGNGEVGWSANYAQSVMVRLGGLQPIHSR